jgi:hypothetical protein
MFKPFLAGVCDNPWLSRSVLDDYISLEDWGGSLATYRFFPLAPESHLKFK